MSDIGQGHNSAAYGQEIGFDFFEFFDMVVNTIGMTSAEKLAQILIARKSHAVSGDTVAPSRTELTRQASCSEATLKRSYRLLETFFTVNKRDGKTTEYTPKSVVTHDEIAAALSQMKRSMGAHSDPGSSAKGVHSEPGSHGTGGHHAPDSVSRGARSGGHGDPGQKRNSPTPPKENNYLNNNHHSKETATARGGGQDLPGLNGSTSVVIEKLAGWIRPGMPDYVTARASLENLVGIYPPEIVRDSFAHLEAKMLSGDIVPSPLKYFMATCRGMNSEAEKTRQKDGKPPGMPDAFWRKMQASKAKERA